MTVAAMPDALGAVLGQLRSFTDLQTFVGGQANPRISGRLKTEWNPMPRGAIVLRYAGGPPEGLLPVQLTRVDMTCYGANALEAMRLWRAALPLLCPPQPGPRSFIRGGCRVYDVAQESGPIPLTDPQSKWNYVVGGLMVRWCSVPVT